MAIERRIVARLGRRCQRSGLRDLPDAAALAAAAPAELEALGLSAGRALALSRAAREVASGRADLRAADHERSWARLRAIPGIGQWTIDVLALHGQGRYDRVPAGDLAYLKWAGRLLRGRPGARAERARGARAARALRRVGRARRCARAAGERRGGLAARDARPRHGVAPASPTPSPGRNSLVSTAPAAIGRSSWPALTIQSM